MFHISFGEDQLFDDQDSGTQIQSLLQQCPVCKKKNAQLRAQVIDERDDAQMVHVACNSCGCHILALVSMGRMGAASVGFVTDLTAQDVTRLLTTKPVTADDVLSITEYLEA